MLLLNFLIKFGATLTAPIQNCEKLHLPNGLLYGTITMWRKLKNEKVSEQQSYGKLQKKC